MIELPWQVIVGAMTSSAIIIIALIMQLRDRADRQTQRDNETVRSTKQAMREGWEAGLDFARRASSNSKDEK